MTSDADAHHVAAVDLGSNSFHMIVARLEDGTVHIVDRLRERVRLAAGFDDERNLSDEARDRALHCLERFGQRIGHMPLGSVWVVGINTLW
jgi:exopolyphosphatase/guanosine-5'-triphosphate,3'-diphosphate pyrophosphatase